MAQKEKPFSKSDYTRGLACPKALWMGRHMPEWEEYDASALARFSAGNEVGELARGYFGRYDYVKGSAATDAWLSQKWDGHRGRTRNAAEATFEWDGRICMVDILRDNLDGTFDVIEVKSSTKVKPYHVHDVAYQVAVVEGCGLTVRKAQIMHVNPGYVRLGELDLKGYFTLEDVTDQVCGREDEIAANIASFEAVRDAQDEPVAEIGHHCRHPFECPFKKWCWRDVPKDSVFAIAGLGDKTAFKMMRDEGIVTVGQLAASARLAKLQPLQRLQAEFDSDDYAADETYDPKALSKFVGALRYPLCFLDFETMQPAIPMYDGHRPYQQVPTQYSLHVKRSPDAPLEHHEYLAPEGADPMRPVAEHLVADVPEGACTLAWNMSFEKTRIKEMAKAFPDLSGRLMGIHDGIVDLMEPFKKGWWYLRAMHGSCSIKRVLPALFPNDPELDYHALDGVHDGSEAMDAYLHLTDADKAPEDVARIRESLLRYCELDTLAMVRIWEAMAEKAEEGRRWLEDRAAEATSA